MDRPLLQNQVEAAQKQHSRALAEWEEQRSDQLRKENELARRLKEAEEIAKALVRFQIIKIEVAPRKGWSTRFSGRSS